LNDAQTIAVEVTGIEQVTPLIKHFRLAPVGGGELPVFSGGSHIIVVMQGAERVHRNPYSLLGSPNELGTYEIGVRRMEESRGGSHFMHDTIQVGSRLEIAHPVNLFGLDKIARKHLLIAGGIGITPFLAQLEDLHDGAVPYELHYSVRAAEHAAFLERLRRLAGARLHMYYDSEGRLIPFEALLANQPLGTHVYVCGPAGMIQHVISTAHACGWPDSHIHWEQFSAPPVGDALRCFSRARKSACMYHPIKACSKASRRPASKCPICAAAASAASATPKFWSWMGSWCTTIIFCRTRKRPRRRASCPACRARIANAWCWTCSVEQGVDP
jgi:ferredoxin-NADP reductase